MLERRPKVAEVAARAGVSTATVDRVINGRGGVHQRTAELVEQTIREMRAEERRSGPAGRAAGRIDVILAGDGTDVTRQLAEAMAVAGAQHGVDTEAAFVERMNPRALADKLVASLAEGSAGVAVQALDHTLVREALHRLATAAVPVVTVLTDMGGIDRVAYVGLDNRAAGRTAGYLMGRFCRAAGTLAIVWGGELYRSHEERESGFRSILRAERPDLQCLEVITGNDDPAVARQVTADAIARNADLVGIYCVGGGVNGVADAIEAAGRTHSLVMIGHNCNSQTKPYLLSGTIDAVIHQDLDRIARAAVEALLARRPPPVQAGIPIEIITRENLMFR